MVRARRLILVLSLLLAIPLAGLLWAAPKDTAPQTPAEIFERCILPIFKSENPSSCTECHLSGVELKNYILPSAEKTFLSLRDQGLIDLDKPENSRILALIDMGNDPKKGAELITQQMREKERTAFSEWILACAADPKLRAAPKLKPEEMAKPPKPNEVIRHARIDKVLASFESTIWAQRFRCGSCHMEGGAENAKLVKENGNITWLKKTPAETLEALREKELIDLKAPEKSLLLAKPSLAVKHGGGKKMEIGDDGYKAFRFFLEDYARSVNNTYAKAADLPPAPTLARFGSDIWFKIDKTPDAWGDKLLQIKLYPWDAKTKSFTKDPIALSDRLVSAKARIWQHSFMLLAAPDSKLAETFAAKPQLPPGKYRVEVYIDKSNKLAKNWQAPLDSTDLVGSTEVDSKWPAGYGKMTIIPATQIK